MKLVLSLLGRLALAFLLAIGAAGGPGTGRRRQTMGVAVLSAAAAASSFAPVSLAAEPSGGSTTGIGICSLQVRATGGGLASSATVVPLEDFTLFASGYVPDGDGVLVATDVKFGTEDRIFVQFTNEGTLTRPSFFTEASAGLWRVTMFEADDTCGAQVEIDVLPLNDVVASGFLLDIKWLFLKGITSGCTPTKFCPNGLLTRGQLATFLSRALSLPATSLDYFTDDETNKHEANINRVREAGITFGCAATTFCPDGIVTRGQMASFLVRAFHLPPTAMDYFTDDESNKHEGNINRMRAGNVTFGCGGANFCPNGSVTRGQMAAFLHRAAE